MDFGLLLVRGLFPHAISGSGGLLYALVLSLVALGLMFAGRSIIKALAFLIVGLAGAGFGAGLGGTYLGGFGSIIGAVLGFIVGGVIGVWLVELGIGLALGYFGYVATRYLTHSLLLGVIVGIILFIVGLALSNKLLELATAILGGFVFYSVLVYFGVVPFGAVIISLVLAAIGFYVQQSRRPPSERWKQT